MMEGSYLGTPVKFIVETLFGLYILAVLLRFLLQCARADFYNPLSQFLVKVTNPPLRPLRRVIPGLGGIDLAAVVLMVLLQMTMLALSAMLEGGLIHPLALLVWAIRELVILLLNLYLFTIFIQVVLSWINPSQYSPVTSLLYTLNAPLLRPAQRLLPPIAGLDLSPMLVIITLIILKMLVVPPLTYLVRAVG